MQCDTTRQGTVSDSMTSPSSPTSPFVPNVSCSSCIVSSIRRPRRKDELTSQPLPQWPHEHLLSILMPYPPIPAATNVATPIPQASVQPRDSPATGAIIILPCANSRRRHSVPPATLPEELTEAPGEPDHPGTTDLNAEVIAPVSPLTGSCAAAPTTKASPAVPPAVPPKVCPPSAWPISWLTPPSSTTRIALRSSPQQQPQLTAQKPWLILKVPCWLSAHLKVRYPFTPGSS